AHRSLFGFVMQRERERKRERCRPLAFSVLLGFSFEGSDIRGEQSDDLAELLPASIEQINGEKSSRAPIPAPAFVGLASRNLQPVGKLLRGTPAIAFFDIGANGAGRPDEL